MISPTPALLAGIALPMSPDDLRRASYRYVESEEPPVLPARGDTVSRWRRLGEIAATDVCLAKILEAHYDAAAILAELGEPPPAAGELWAVWAAEPPSVVLSAVLQDDDCVHLHGQKAWCSGADVVTHALITARAGEDRLLFRVDLSAKGLSSPATAWSAVGMQRVVSGELTFEDVGATLVGRVNSYLSRPGFWHGGAGIAACWYGATAAIAETLRKREGLRPLAAVNLGVIDVNLAAAAALLRETASLIDAQPSQPHTTEVIRVRSFVERVALDTIDRVGRALGPGPLCLDAAHAQRCADLAVFVRQSHADQDWQSLGEQAASRNDAWTL